MKNSDFWFKKTVDTTSIHWAFRSKKSVTKDDIHTRYGPFIVGNIEVLGFLKKRDAYNLIERFGDHKSDLSILKIEHHRRRGAINALNVLDRIHWEDGAKVRLYKEE